MEMMVQVYLWVALVVFGVVMACSGKAFFEYKNSSERLQKQSFAEAFLTYAFAALVCALFWIVVVPFAVARVCSGK